MPESLDETRAKLQAHFADTPVAGHSPLWEELWKGTFQPWDRGTPNPALADFLKNAGQSSGSAIPSPLKGDSTRSVAFVPGCGGGYDVLLLASYGFDVVGLEVSESAVKRCIEERDKNGSKYPIQDTSIGQGSATFVTGDFFDSSWAEKAGRKAFDLIYDYTFLCALSPSTRPAWASRMRDLLADDGVLVCSEFPVIKDPKLGGPPFALPPAVYLKHLAHPGEDIPYLESGYIDEQHELSDKDHGLKRTARWQPARTHPIGENTEWMSLWKHA